MNPAVPCLAFAFALPLAAQTVTAVITPTTNPSATAIDGPIVDARVLPLPAPPSGMLLASTPHSAASVIWSAWADTYEAQVNVTQNVRVDATTPPGIASASVGPNEFRIDFGATAPTSGWVFLSRTQGAASGGATVPKVGVDWNDDGVVDLPDLPAAGLVFQMFDLGVTPAPFRIVFESTLATPGQSWLTVTAWLRPQNDLVQTTMVTGCSLAPLNFQIHESFVDRGIDILTQQQLPNHATIAVIGLQPQPVLLPSDPAAPCILLPSPDILSFDLHLPLPPALRPLTFYVQGVIFIPATGAMLTVDAVRVMAL